MAIYNRVLEGDCTEVLQLLPSDSVDLVITDPPYFVHYRDRMGRTIANDEDQTNVLDAFVEVYRVLKPDTFCISFYSWNHVDTFFSAWRRAGFRPVGHLVWHKDYASRTGFLRARHEQAYLLAKGRPARPVNSLDDVRRWKYSGNVRHPTEKDVSILQPLIEGFSKPGDLVLDPFAGSGSTLVAAAQAGRRYLGIELERKYCELARERLVPLADRAADEREDHVRELNDPEAQDLWQWLQQRGDHELTRMVRELLSTHHS